MHSALDIAIATAMEAGELLLSRVGLPLEERDKAVPGDLVTASDHASEALIVERLKAATPQATIVAEEGGERTGTADERWIVDPLDGTTNYAHGYPFFCVSIAYERGGSLCAAAIYAPSLRELYAAERGAGATCNGRRIASSSVTALDKALVCTGFTPGRYERNGRHFERLSRLAQAVRRDGSAALDLALVARGVYDAFWEFDLHAWDVAAGTLLVREAGGLVSGSGGEPFSVDAGAIVASNGPIHEALQKALTGP